METIGWKTETAMLAILERRQGLQKARRRDRGSPYPIFPATRKLGSTLASTGQKKAGDTPATSSDILLHLILHRYDGPGSGRSAGAILVSNESDSSHREIRSTAKPGYKSLCRAGKSNGNVPGEHNGCIGNAHHVCGQSESKNRGNRAVDERCPSPL